MLVCKICHLNETDSTSGICWECCLGEKDIKEQVIANPKIIRAEFLGSGEPSLGELFYPYRDYLEWLLNQPEFWMTHSIPF